MSACLHHCLGHFLTDPLHSGWLVGPQAPQAVHPHDLSSVHLHSPQHYVAVNMTMY